MAAILVMGLAADQTEHAAVELIEDLKAHSTMESDLSRIDGSPTAGLGVGYDLSLHTIDGGGTSVGGTFELSGTIGPPDVGVMTVERNCPITGDLNCDDVVDSEYLFMLLAE